MNVKKNLAVVLSALMALSAQITTPVMAASDETISIDATGSTDVAVEENVSDTASETFAKLPRVTLEYEGIEVVDSSQEMIELADGKKLYIACGEKKKYKDMFKKGNKLNISGVFAYRESEDIYFNCTAEIAITPCNDTSRDEELEEKIAKLPQVEICPFGFYVVDSTEDTLLLDNGMKVYVSCGKQKYTDMFKFGNEISIDGLVAYDAETDMYYNVDSEIYVHQYSEGFSYSTEEELQEYLARTTTSVEDVVIPTTTTTAYIPELREESDKQPEGKYPFHLFTRIMYHQEKTTTVYDINGGAVVDEDGIRWIFDSRQNDIYELGRGDVIKIDGWFLYYPWGDEFGAFYGGYELISEGGNYEQYATIEIKEEFPHKVLDKRLSNYSNVAYNIELPDVEVTEVVDSELLVLDDKYSIAFNVNTSPDLADVKEGDHISVTGWFVYLDGFEIYSTSTISKDWDDLSSYGRFSIISSADTKVSDKKGDSNIDGDTDLADSVLVMQSLANPDNYSLTEQGAINADVYGNNDGVTGMDAVGIQYMLLNKELV